VASLKIRDLGTKWPAILLFGAGPWIILGIIAAVCPAVPSEPVLKAGYFHQRPLVDTVVIGDSRVLGISEEPFVRRGWAYFNMGMSGLSPEDILLQLEYALAHGKIRRVIMGMSFESMTESYPFEFSRYRDEPPFRALSLSAYDLPEQVFTFHLKGMRDIFRPPLWASMRLKRLVRPEVAVFLPNGNGSYLAIERSIHAGTYDFHVNRDPKTYFLRDDGEERYLNTRVLSPHALKLYAQIFARLRARGIPCLVFETGRRPEYQAMIDEQPVLSRLQGEWRGFLRTQSFGGIRALSFQEMAADYDLDDFFDSCHFIGPTEGRVGEHLAAALAGLERISFKQR